MKNAAEDPMMHVDKNSDTWKEDDQMWKYWYRDEASVFLPGSMYMQPQWYPHTMPAIARAIKCIRDKGSGRKRTRNRNRYTYQVPQSTVKEEAQCHKVETLQLDTLLATRPVTDEDVEEEIKDSYLQSPYLHQGTTAIQVRPQKRRI